MGKTIHSIISSQKFYNLQILGKTRLHIKTDMINDSIKIKRLSRLLKLQTNQLRVQSKQIEQLRIKTFILQEALIKNNNLSICNLNHPLESLSPVIVNHFPKSRTTVIAFGGMLTKLGMPPAEFLRSFIDKQINTIFIKDFRQCWYQQGLLGLSTSVTETAEIIKNQIPANQEKICTFGTSAGGFAAILFGVLIGADEIAAFGPQTLITKETFDAYKSTDSRLEDINLTDPFLDLQQLLATTNFNNPIHIHFAKLHEADKTAAKRLEGFTNVHLHPWKTNGHNIAGWLKKNDQLENIFASLLAV